MKFFRQLCLDMVSLMVSALLLRNETKQAASGVFPSKGLKGDLIPSSEHPDGIYSVGTSALA